MHCVVCHSCSWLESERSKFNSLVVLLVYSGSEAPVYSVELLLCCPWSSDAQVHYYLNLSICYNFSVSCNKSWIEQYWVVLCLIYFWYFYFCYLSTFNMSDFKTLTQVIFLQVTLTFPGVTFRSDICTFTQVRLSSTLYTTAISNTWPPSV